MASRGDEDFCDLPGETRGARKEGDCLHGECGLGNRGQVPAAHGIEDDDPAARPPFFLHNPPQGLLPGRDIGQINPPDGQGGLAGQQIGDFGFPDGRGCIRGGLRESNRFLADHHDPGLQKPVLLRVGGGQKTEGKIGFRKYRFDLGTDVAAERGIDLLIEDRELFGVEALQETGQNIEGLRRRKIPGSGVDHQDVRRRVGGEGDGVLAAEGDQEGLHASLGKLNARIGPTGQVIGNQQTALTTPQKIHALSVVFAQGRRPLDFGLSCHGAFFKGLSRS